MPSFINPLDYEPEFPHPFLPNSPDEILDVPPEDYDDEDDEDW